MAEDGEYNPFAENGLHTVYVFYDQESAEQVYSEADRVAQRFAGYLGVVMVDV